MKSGHSEKMICFLGFDILVIGCGLAGMKAALSALETNSALRVILVSSRPAPTGSSFTNRNNALGIITPETDREKELFVARAAEIASPGEICPELLQILADESHARFLELDKMGLNFSRSGNKSDGRFHACFAPDLKIARIFTDLGRAESIFRRRLLSLGAEFMPGLRLIELVSSSGGGESRVDGGLFRRAADDSLCVITAKATIVAMGGPAALYARTHAGEGVTGDSLAILKNAGARLINPWFVQFMWADVFTHAFTVFDFFTEKTVSVLKPSGEKISPPAKTAALQTSRLTHCPYAFGFEDGKIDLFLAENLHAEGYAEIISSAGKIVTAPFAHCGNGGALTDEYGRTGVDSLYACGECAGGMHGANRIGGAMVAATQVFGKRAGVAAAMEASGAKPSAASLSLDGKDIANGLRFKDERQFETARLELGKNMGRYAVLGGRPGIAAFHEQLKANAGDEPDPRLKTMYQSAMIIIDGLLSDGNKTA